MVSFLWKATLLTQTIAIILALQYIYTTQSRYAVMVSTAPRAMQPDLSLSTGLHKTFTKQLAVSSPLPPALSKPQHVPSSHKKIIIGITKACTILMILVHLTSVVYIKISEMTKARIERHNIRLINNVKHLANYTNGTLLLGTSKSSVQLCSSRRVRVAAYVLNRNGDQYMTASG
jgi:hypothetical protein